MDYSMKSYELFELVPYLNYFAVDYLDVQTSAAKTPSMQRQDPKRCIPQALRKACIASVNMQR